MKPIAFFRSPFATKFGVPKQSGLVEELEGKIVFEPDYRNADYLRGIDGFDYLWLIWEFSANRHVAASPTVRPPLLGGNRRVGVFATRSPYRPNPIGLSAVRLTGVEWHGEKGPTLHVSGADLTDGTPILDIKPYLPYADSHARARVGFVDENPLKKLKVEIPDAVLNLFTAQEQAALRKTLELDPRPHYHDDPEKCYGMLFCGRDIHFRVSDGICHVISEGNP